MDVTLLLVDPDRKLSYRFHKIILYASCAYFKKLLIGFKEKDLYEITIHVANANVCYDVIRSFYGYIGKYCSPCNLPFQGKDNKTNLNALPEWQYQLEYIKCCDFLGIPLVLENYKDLIVPTEGCTLLLSIGEITNHPNEIVELIIPLLLVVGIIISKYGMPTPVH